MSKGKGRNATLLEKARKDGYWDAINITIDAFAIAAIDNKVSEEKVFKIVSDTIRYIEYAKEHLIELEQMRQMRVEKTGIEIGE